jgi:glycolate oxidase iron-sulfur subunit
MRAGLAAQYGVGWKKHLFYKNIMAGKRFLSFSSQGFKLARDFILPYLPINPRIASIYFKDIPWWESPNLCSGLPEYIPRQSEDFRGKIIYFPGCLTNYIIPGVGKALIRVLSHMGYDVILPKGLRCCSYPIFMAGQEEWGLANLKKNLEILTSYDALGIVTGCPTCGLAFKKIYLSILQERHEDLSLAESISARSWDISEFIYKNNDPVNLLKRETLPGIEHEFIYHDPCHLAFGQGIKKEPRELLKLGQPGALKEFEGPITCCGSGGAFHLFFPDISAKIAKNRVQDIEKTQVKTVVTGCPACIIQLGSNLAQESEDYQVLHTIQWLDRAIGNKT